MPRSWILTWGLLVVFIGVSLSAGAVGAFFMPGAWYDTLAKPAWTPPGWVFGPVWTLLYVLMGIAAWRVGYRAGGSGAWGFLTLFFIHLLVNAAWSWLFFGLRQPAWAMADLTLLWVMVLAMMLWAWQVDRPASVLLWPYLAWVSYAGTLNAGIVWLNR